MPATMTFDGNTVVGGRAVRWKEHHTADESERANLSGERAHAGTETCLRELRQGFAG